MRRAVAAATVVLLGLLPGCAQQASAQERIAQAPATTQQEQTALVATEVFMSGGGQDVTMTAQGGIDFANQRSTMTMDLGDEAAAQGFGEMTLIMDGTVVYLQLPQGAALGVDTPWVKMDTAEMAGMEGLGQLQQTGNDPTKSMELLQGVSDDVTEVGSEDVRGEPTTHYRATINLQTAMEQVPEDARPYLKEQIDLLGTDTLPVDVWLDEQGRLRRQRMDLDLSNLAGGGPDAPSTMTITFEMYDFGASVDADPPPADQVTDFADLGLGG